MTSTCYAQAGITASGQETRAGIVANDFLPLGTHIRLDQSVFGRRNYVVEDRIGWGSELDVFNSSESACLQYGRRTIGFRTLR